MRILLDTHIFLWYISAFLDRLCQQVIRLREPQSHFQAIIEFLQ
jgi:PIN domain nuclease of toxin-antitoxin system